VHLVGLFLSSLLKMHGPPPKKKIEMLTVLVFSLISSLFDEH